jgi:putative transposase
MVTSKHIHLLAFDSGGRHVLPDSIKLVPGRTGQEYNVRKKRKGAFWEDRYHATGRKILCTDDPYFVRL